MNERMPINRTARILDYKMITGQTAFAAAHQLLCSEATAARWILLK